jgi:hypothetical protein
VHTATQKGANRNGRGFGWDIAHAAVSRRTSISFSRIVARTDGYTYAAKVWDSSIVQGPFSVAPRQTLPLRFATIFIVVRLKVRGGVRHELVAYVVVRRLARRPHRRQQRSRLPPRAAVAVRQHHIAVVRASHRLPARCPAGEQRCHLNQAQQRSCRRTDTWSERKKSSGIEPLAAHLGKRLVVPESVQ